MKKRSAEAGEKDGREMQVTLTPISYETNIKPYDESIVISQRRGRDVTRWAILRDVNGGVCLNTSGEWEHEPQPSSRDDAFFERCRFATLEIAKAFLEGWWGGQSSYK